MSWPVTMYYCTACDFEQGDAATWGTREYVLGSGVRIPVRWRMGWCESCNGLAAIEDLSSTTRIQDYRGSQAGLHKLFQRWGGLHFGLSKSERSLRRMYEDNMEDAIDALEMLSVRKSPPHCLQCLSTRVQVPEIRAGDRDDVPSSPCVYSATAQPEESESAPIGKAEKYDWRHPGCGGEIRTRENEDGLRLALRPCVHRFTPEGMFIEKEYVGGYSAPGAEYRDALSEANRNLRALRMTDLEGSSFFGIPKFLRKCAD